MIEKLLCSAFAFEQDLPKVKQKSRVGWWPIYDKDYPDEAFEHHGNVEAYNLYIKMDLTPHQRKIVFAYCGTGDVVLEPEALKVYKEATLVEYKELLESLRRRYGRQARSIVKMY